MSDVRSELDRLIQQSGSDYAGVSRLIGRNAAYVQQFIKRGTPKRLAEQDRRRLADYFGIGEERLGGSAAAAAAADYAPVPVLDVGASAGPGSITGREDERAHIAFDARWLRTLGLGKADDLSIIRVEGDSMLPTLAHGDEILVDRGDGTGRLRDGIYVVRVEGALIVKRLAVNPAARRVAIRSDNRAYPDWPECDLDAIDVVGRVLWAGRRL